MNTIILILTMLTQTNKVECDSTVAWVYNIPALSMRCVDDVIFKGGFE